MTDGKPRLLWHSNAAHSPTGYGQQTALFTQRLKEDYDLGISAFYGLEGNVLVLGGIPTYPGVGQTHGNETIRAHAKVHFKDDLRGGLVLTLLDVWVLDPAVWRTMNVCSWVPVDHEPAPGPVVDFFTQSGAVPIAMSKFGEQQLRGAGLDPLYVPHAVDTSVYRPIDKAEAREKTNMPQDEFIVGMVAANKGNPSRKCFHEAIQAFKLFHRGHPDSKLYIHSEMTGMFDGVDIPHLVRAVGLDPAAVLHCDQYRAVHYPHSPEAMANVYSSFDVLLSPSAGEGFGIPVIEAQACGVPVIVSDFSAQPELVGAGWLVEGRKVYTPIKSWQFLPDIEDIADALRQAAIANADLHAQKAREFALGYDIDRVLSDHMLPALEEVAERFADREPVAA